MKISQEIYEMLKKAIKEVSEKHPFDKHLEFIREEGKAKDENMMHTSFIVEF
jgi:hypothetical protein